MNNKILSLIDYDNCLTNLSSSILQYYGLVPPHKTLKSVDEILKTNRGKRNVILLLLDGLGFDLMEKTTQKSGFFRSNLVAKYNSVFPPTTTAATTSLITGLNPSEHGWLGWTQYFPQECRDVILFTNRDSQTGRYLGTQSIAEKYLPVETIMNIIQKEKKATSHIVASFIEKMSFETFLNNIKKVCEQGNNNFVYAYWNQPDNMLHKNGLNDAAKDFILYMEQKIEQMSNDLQDTLLIITADHGHHKIKYFDLEDYPEITKMLKRPITMEQRATSFYLKKEYLSFFKTRFYEDFGENFLLLSKEEALSNNIFGSGVERSDLCLYIGDYVAISVNDWGFVNSHDDVKLVSQHAGLTKSEMEIPLIIVNCKKQ